MKITIFTGCQSVGQKDNRRTGCAIVLFATSPDGKCQRRQLTFGLGPSPYNLASLQATRLALLSLRPWVAQRQLDVSVSTENRYVLDMLAKVDDKYKTNPQVNVETVTLLRTLFDKMPRVILTHYKLDSGIGQCCQALARDAAESQSSSDSGTKEYANVVEAGLQA